MPLGDSSRPKKIAHYTPDLLPSAIYVASGNSATTFTNSSYSPQGNFLSSVDNTLVPYFEGRYLDTGPKFG